MPSCGSTRHHSARPALSSGSLGSRTLRPAAASGSSFVGFQPFPRARRAEIGDVAARSDVMPSPAVVLGSVVEDTAALRILASLESMPRVVLLGPVDLQEEPREDLPPTSSPGQKGHGPVLR